MVELLKIMLSLSLSGSLLILVLFLCKSVVKNKLSKRWQYYIWLVVIARLLIPLAPQRNLMDTLFQHVDSTVIQMNETLHSQRSDGNLPEEVFGYQDKQVGNAGEESLEYGRLLAKIGDICLLVWLMAAVGLFIRKVTIYQSFVKYIKAGRIEVLDLALWERVGNLIEQSGVTVSVGLYTNSLISSPLLVGFFRPCIMLPTTQLSDSDFQYTILHELTHYKRYDMFYKWLVQFAVCLHWFNPLVHFMCREVGRACELACDEAVIGTLDVDGRQAYGDTLLNAVGAGGSYKDSLASVTLSESKERLKERLDSIMKFKTKTKMTTAISIMLAMVLCFGATTVGAYTPSPSDTSVLNLSSSGRGSITQSGSFESTEGQVLTLSVQSDIQGGAVDLFLFPPNRKEQRLTFDGSDQTVTVALSAGRWDYNCTGFFRSGDIVILGELKPADTTPLSSQITAEKEELDPCVIDLSSDGRGKIIQSGSFVALEHQVLTLTVKSNIQGGEVNLTLFPPDGKQRRFTFDGADQTETMTLSAGRWSYNCTGFFESGDITIVGELSEDESLR